MEQNNNQTAVAQEILQPIVSPTETKEFLMSTIGQSIKKFELTQRMAKVYTHSTIVPQTYQGDGNIGNVMIALDMAERMQLNPLQVMQNLYIVYGNPAWSSKFLIAMFNQCGRYSSLRYEEKGKQGTDEWGMRAYAYEISDTEQKHPIYGAWVTIGIAKSEGWMQKKGSKWVTMPELMLRYRSASQFINTTAPELSMGLMTQEEAEDVHRVVDADYEEIQPRRASFDEKPSVEATARVVETKTADNTETAKNDSKTTEQKTKKSAQQLFAE